jgi:septation ring formation regulator EzrA
MPTLEERVAYLEGRGEEHAAAITEVRLDVRELRAEMIRRFEQVDRRFEQIDRRFEQIERRFDQMDNRFSHMDNRFNWSVGLQFATLLAVIALLGSYYR